MEQTTKRRAIVINSLGILDTAAITLMGVSTKRDDHTKIGMFGTGLKYSIAKLLRDAVPFRIYNGEHELAITTQAGDFRGTAYQQIMVDGMHTSITTEMGPQWETWWVMREILSNARDESVYDMGLHPWDEVEFKEGWTTFVLDFEAFEQVWLAREKYFVTERVPKWESEGLRIYGRFAEGGTRIYKNGILIREDEAEDAFDYDLLGAELNEMREPRYQWQLATEITEQLITDLDDEALVRAWMNRVNTHIRYAKAVYSGKLSTFGGVDKLNDTWKKVVDSIEQPIHRKEAIGPDLPTDALVIPDAIHGLVRKHVNQTKPLVFANPNPAQLAQLDMAIVRMEACGVDCSAPIKVTDDFGPQQIAQAINGTVVLSPRAFARDLPFLISTLLEEFLHITTGHGDGSREFQTSIFNGWTNTIIKTTTPK